MSEFLDRACQYIQRTGGNPTVARFDEDFEPIGRKLRVDLQTQGLAIEAGGGLTLTAAGRSRLAPSLGGKGPA